MGFIFWLSHRSFLPKEPKPWYIELLESLRPIPPDKLVHFVLYAILARLGWIALGKRPVVLWVICFIYGALDEWHQSFVPLRHPDVWDVMADGLGAFCAIITMFWWELNMKKKGDLIGG